MARAAVSKAEKTDTRALVLEAAKKVLRQSGYAKLSTRDVAAVAGVPLSQIHYHFGSKQGMVLALFAYLNAQLLERQERLFGNASLSLSERRPDAEPAPIRLRDHRTLSEQLPKRERRPSREPDRTPVRSH